MNYTLVSYQAHYERSGCSKGCCANEWVHDSDHHIACGDVGRIVTEWVEKLLQNRTDEHGWDCTLLIDGLTYSDCPPEMESEFVRVEELVKAQVAAAVAELDRKKQEAQTAAEAVKAQKKLEAERAAEEAQRALYETLKTKFENQ